MVQMVHIQLLVPGNKLPVATKKKQPKTPRAVMLARKAPVFF